MKGYLLRCVGRYWHLADNPTVPAFVGYWTNNGQRAELGLNGSAAIDPYRPSNLPYTVALARDNRDARKKAINQGERHENEL